MPVTCVDNALMG